MRRIVFAGLFLALRVLVATGSASGAVLVSNLSGTTAGNASPQSTFWMAQAFTTDGNAYTASSVTIRGARHATQSLAVYLYQHNSGGNVPVTGATDFGQFDATGVTSVIGSQTMPAMGTINLAANTTYWIVVQPSNVNTALWTLPSNLGNLSGAGAIPNRRATSNNSGTTWSGLTDNSANLMIQVDVDAAPVELMEFSVE